MGFKSGATTTLGIVAALIGTTAAAGAIMYVMRDKSTEPAPASRNS
jgi:alkylated DNA nucleotide flippase Atl1